MKLIVRQNTATDGETDRVMTHQHRLEHGEKVVLPRFSVGEEDQYSIDDNVLSKPRENGGRVLGIQEATQVRQDGRRRGGVGGL